MELCLTVLLVGIKRRRKSETSFTPVTHKSRKIKVTFTFSSLDWLPLSLLSPPSLSLSLSCYPIGVRTFTILPLYSLSHIIHTHTHTHKIPTSHSLDFPSLPFCLHRDLTPTTHTHTHTPARTHRLKGLPGWLINFWHTAITVTTFFFISLTALVVKTKIC